MIAYLVIYIDYNLVSFKKVDAKNESKALAGAKFTLYDASFNEVTSVTTGDDGMAKFTKLNPGSYSVKEVSAPKGYTPNNQSFSFTITTAYVNTTATVVKNSSTVQTGHQNPYRYATIAAIIVAVGVIVWYLIGKKLKK